MHNICWGYSGNLSQNLKQKTIRKFFLGALRSGRKEKLASYYAKVEFSRDALESLKHLIHRKGQKSSLVLEGQIHSALRFLGETSAGGVLELTNDVIDQLKEKHPNPQSVKMGSLLFGPIDDIPKSVYSEINGEMVRQAALRAKGSGRPCGVDANDFRRILAGLQVI